MFTDHANLTFINAAADDWYALWLEDVCIDVIDFWRAYTAGGEL